MHSDPTLAIRSRDDRPTTVPPDAAATALRNQLIGALPPDELARLLPLCEPVAIGALQPLAEPGEPPPFAYFPESAVISMVRCMSDGSSIEVGTVGREGMTGLAALLGDPSSPWGMVGQVPGACTRVPLAPLTAALPGLPTLAGLVRRSALAFADQIGQRVACNSLHTVEQRCARWLLAAHDAVDGDEVHLTHESLARALAVRRAGVTEAALTLQRAGLIRYTRGHVRVLDRAGLARVACECYGVIRANRARLLGSAAAPEVGPAPPWR